MDGAEGAMVAFAIYHKPLDYPDHWVVRRWFSLSDGRVVPDVVPRLADTLAEARALVPPGLVRMTDSPDPFLFESWL